MIFKERYTILLLFASLLTSMNMFCNARDILSATEVITDGETLISSGGSFELGFFSPSTSKNRYVGIWYKKITDFTVVWVANRDRPLVNTSGAMLKVIEPGILALKSGSNAIVWSSNTSGAARIPVAQLLDSGNLVVRDENDDNSENYLWQSFEYPTDTVLPGMKFGRNLVTGHETYISSWKTNEDPATGDYSYHLDPTGYPQAILEKGSAQLYRSGPWNGVKFSGASGLKNTSTYFEFVFNNKEVYFHPLLINGSVVTRFTLNQSGITEQWIWVERTKGWDLYLVWPIDYCDSYRKCGAYGSCNIESSPACECLGKFVPAHPENWASADWFNGCARRTPLNCETDGFIKYSDIKLPDTRFSVFNVSMTLEECKVKCSKNCSCTAYTNSDITNGGSGCLLWFGDLVDIKRMHGDGGDIYIRMASSELDNVEDLRRKKHGIIIMSFTSVMGMILLLMTSMLCVCKGKNMNPKQGNVGSPEESHNKDQELPCFDLSMISKATNNFSSDNKLGQGGFGPVYKGKLEDGQEIAVKRLSEKSMQGLDEFKNEVICIAKLQHRNLVKLLGCCIQGKEKMLIYEYMANRSLDLILFDETKSKLLDWPRRYQIINGIARGLLYLHQDSRLRIIHRDLKASNILLDSDMNPRISDFGMARSFGGNETEANTSTIVGTYGYISPEYAIDGVFSLKSDVYSFGVMVLEILSGKRNRGFSHRVHNHNLLGHAWLLYKEGRSLELLDDNLGEPCCMSEIMRSIHVGLLCVQKYPIDRPSMSSVVFMLENEIVLPQVKEPGFFTERDPFAYDTTTSTKVTSMNEITMTMLEAR